MDEYTVSRVLGGLRRILDLSCANLGGQLVTTATQVLAKPDGSYLAKLLTSIAELLGRGGLAGVERPGPLRDLIDQAGLFVQHLSADDVMATCPCHALLRQLVFNIIPDCLKAAGYSQFDHSPLLLPLLLFGLRSRQLLLKQAPNNPTEQLAVLEALLPSIAALTQHQGGSVSDEGHIMAVLMSCYNLITMTAEDEALRSLLHKDPTLAAAVIHTATLALRRVHANLSCGWAATKAGGSEHEEPTKQRMLESLFTQLGPCYLPQVDKLLNLILVVEDTIGDQLVLRQAVEQVCTARLDAIGWWIQQEQYSARAGKPATTDPFPLLFVANQFLLGMQILGDRIDACAVIHPVVGHKLASLFGVVQQVLAHWSTMGQWGFGEESTAEAATALTEQVVSLAGLLVRQAGRTARQLQLLQCAGHCVSTAVQRYFSEPVLLVAARGLYSILMGDKRANSIVMQEAPLHHTKLDQQVRRLPQPEVEVNWSWLQSALRFKARPSNPSSEAPTAAVKHLREVKERRELQGKQPSLGAAQAEASAAATAERAAEAEAAAAQLLREIEEEEKARLEKASKRKSKKKRKQQRNGKQAEEVKEDGPVPQQPQQDSQQQAPVMRQQQQQQERGASSLVSTAPPCRCPLSPANHLTRSPCSAAVAPPPGGVDSSQQHGRTVLSPTSCESSIGAAHFSSSIITEAPAERSAPGAGRLVAAHYRPSLRIPASGRSSGTSMGSRSSGTTITAATSVQPAAFTGRGAAVASPAVGGGSEEAELSELFSMLGIPYSATSPLSSAPPPSALPAKRNKQQPAQGLGKPAAASTATLPAAGEDDGCVVCMLADAEAVLVPCGHMILCWGCAASMYGQAGQQHCCPMCRAEVVEFVQVRAR